LQPTQVWGGVKRFFAGEAKSEEFGGRHTTSDAENRALRIQEEQEAQARLGQASARAMTIHYCRDHGSNSAWRFVRGLSIDVNFDFRRWKRHQKASRHLDIWKPRNILRADNIRRLVFPDLFFIGMTSSLITYYNTFLAAPAVEEAVTHLKHGFNLYLHDGMLALPLECLTVTSVAMGLLVTFKTQTSYARFTDARSQWGLMINECRSIASRILTRIPHHSGDERLAQAQVQALKLIRTLPITFKYHLTEDGCNPHILIRDEMTDAEIREAVNWALEAELVGVWDMEDERERDLADRLLASDHRPLFVLHELHHINADIFSSPLHGNLHPIFSSEIDNSLNKLHGVLGACEKILRTPIYTPYTKFTSRFLYTWCNLLPLPFYPLAGPLGTVPVTLIISFFMLGIEDIGSRVEQPFDVLPLWQYCQTIDASCEQMVRHSELLRQTEHSFSVADSLGGAENGDLYSFVDPL